MAAFIHPKHTRQVSYLLFSIVFLCAFSVSCRVTMVAPYEEAISQQTELISKKIDKLYLTMLETTKNENNEREYLRFAEHYIDIEVELNSLLNKNRMRPLNRESVLNCEIALESWLKYKEKHRTDNGMNDVDIDLNRDFFRDLFLVILIGEEAKAKIR
jgi:hypothetical protein